MDSTTLNNSNNVGLVPLMQAVIQGNVACCEELVAAGADPNVTTSFGWSSVHFSSALGKDRCLASIVDKVPVDQQDESGFTPMHLAALGGHTGAVDVLVRAGHSLRSRSDEFATPLHLAAQEGRLFTVKRLCKLQDDVDDVDMAGCTSLTIAARAGNNNIAKELLVSGANPNHLTKIGTTGLSVAAENGRLDIAKTLLHHGACVRPQDLVAAADAGFANVLQEMLPCIEIVNDAEAKGIRVRSSSSGGRMASPMKQIPRLSLSHALHAAVKKSHLAATTVLLDAGAEINSLVGNDGLSPLCRAIKFSAEADVVELLLSRGGDAMTKTSSSSETYPLLLASERGRLDVLKLILLRTTKCLSQQDKKGRSSLMFAMSLNDKTMFKYLLQCSIGTYNKLPSLKNPAGENVLHLGARLGHVPCIKEMLGDSRSKSTMNAPNMNKLTPIHLACRGGHLSTVKLLLSHQAKVNTSDNKGTSPLQSSCEAGAIDLVQLLLSAGSTPVTKKLNGATPLHAVARRGRADILTMLLRRLKRVGFSKKSGAIELLNSTMKRCGSTALMLAVREGHLESMSMLARCEQVDVDRCNFNGDTPLMESTRMGDLTMCRVLVECGADPRLRCSETSPLGWSERKRDEEMSAVLLWRPVETEESGKGVEVVGGGGGGGGRGGGGGGCVIS